MRTISDEALAVMIKDAHMAGQADAGVDPSWSNAIVYAERAVNAPDAQGAAVQAPTDNGIAELDDLCGKYNRNEIDIVSLTCGIWNAAYFEGIEFGEQHSHPLTTKE